jgi:hypothetical protein
MKVSLPEVQSMVLSDAQKLRAHPEFRAACSLFAYRYIAVLKSMKPLIYMATDEVRQIVGAYVLDRHFSYVPNDASSGVSISDVQAFCTTHMLAGHNRTGSMLNLLREHGYLNQRKETHDRRIKRLEVTPAALAASKRLVTPFLLALSLLEHDDTVVRRLEEDDRFLAEIVGFWSRYFLAYGSLTGLVPQVHLFMDRNAGYEILLKLISTEQPGEVMPDRTVHFHYGATADYFGVSRVHVRRLLEDAENAGYVSLHAPGGRAVEIHPALRDVVDTFVSLQIEHLHLAGRQQVS